MVPQDKAPSPELHTAIYFLLGRDGRVHYVGKSTRPGARFLNHLRAARLNARWKCARWLRGELKRGFRPTMRVVEWCGDGWAAREAYWIAEGRKLGWPLKNQTDGGDGLPGYRHEISDATRKRMSASARNRRFTEAEEYKLRVIGQDKRFARAVTRNALVRECIIDGRLLTESAADMSLRRTADGFGRMAASKRGKRCSAAAYRVLVTMGQRRNVRTRLTIALYPFVILGGYDTRAVLQ